LKKKVKKIHQNHLLDTSAATSLQAILGFWAIFEERPNPNPTHQQEQMSFIHNAILLPHSTASSSRGSHPLHQTKRNTECRRNRIFRSRKEGKKGM
jgi:hypothetical protein